MNAKKQWECGNCETTHDDEQEARLCCMPAVKIVYVCETCEESHQKEQQAEACCDDSGSAKCLLCGHERSNHDTDNDSDCNVWLNDVLGECPCAGFVAD